MRILSFLLLAGTLYGQAAVEAGLGASRAATSTAPAAGIGKSIAGAFGSLNKTLNGGQSGDPVTTEVITVRSTLATQPKPSGKTYENIAKAEVGLEYDALIQRFGPAALEVAGEGGVKKLTYPGKDGSTQVEVKEGKVSAVNLPKAQPGVMVLPK
ncbi:MAG TPA: hypothetical protein VNV86_01355 [Candidatus Acidoferrum sp.]|nr:hypothetical protein [Candidatus Acidoferrum sp.]